MGALGVFFGGLGGFQGFRLRGLGALGFFWGFRGGF